MSAAPTTLRLAPEELAAAVAERVSGGARFAGLVASAHDDGSTVLQALLASHTSLDVIESALPPGTLEYPALTPLVPPAAWYEREIRDLFGIEPVGHPRLDPLVLPLVGVEPARPRPGTTVDLSAVTIDPSPLPAHVTGEGLFTIPYGPVRSGVFESIEYLVESYGEDIPHLRTRVYYKHRGIERRFGDLAPHDAVLLAEPVEGTAAVAHAIAFSQALEGLAGVDPPAPAALLRVVHAELERVASHLDSVIRHTEGAGQAVAYARIALHKERLMRLRAQMCGHRFGRGVVVPGGVSGPMLRGQRDALPALERLEAAVADDVQALMASPSFLDRLRRTGVVPPETARQHGALGPVGRGSGLGEDVRVTRPYGAYRHLGLYPARPRDGGDALARQQVRLDEIAGSFHIVRQALEQLGEIGGSTREVDWRRQVQPVDGIGLGWVEAPQGELIYLVEVRHGQLCRVNSRTASFHNFALLPKAFRGDILTDFVFIEASFGLSVAGRQANAVGVARPSRGRRHDALPKSTRQLRRGVPRGSGRPRCLSGTGGGSRCTLSDLGHHAGR
jgi:formate hydrogenlyase subunit 5